MSVITFSCVLLKNRNSAFWQTAVITLQKIKSNERQTHTPAPRQARSEVTRQTMMRAAEKLFARKGPENVTARAIVEAAGQKNESALQYHFGGRKGLVREIHKYWSDAISEQRAALISEIGPPTSLRDIVLIMFTPGFSLATQDPAYRRYVKAFGPEIVLSELPAITRVPARKGANRLIEVLQAKLPHLCDETLGQRLDWAIRVASMSIAQQAGKKNAFKGKPAELAYHQTIDAMVGILGAEVSREAQALEPNALERVDG